MQNSVKYFFSGLVAAALIFGVFIATQFFFRKSYDPVSHCLEPSPKTNHIFIIDRTDPWKKDLAKSLEQKILDNIKNVSRGDRVVVYELTGDVEHSTIYKINTCSPGKLGDDAFQRLNTGTHKIKDQYSKAFEQPLEQVILQLINAKSEGFTPLAELLGVIGIDKNFQDANNKIVHIFSDMRQKSRDSQFVFTDISYPSQDKFKIWLSSKLKNNFSNTEVFVHYIQIATPSGMKMDQLYEYWKTGFENSGAKFSWEALGQ